MENYKIKRTDKAENDLLEIALYIATRNSVEIAYKIVDEFEQAIINLKEMPYRGTPEKFIYTKKTGYRYLIIENYLIHYHIDENNQIVYIDRIRHGSVSPQNQL